MYKLMCFTIIQRRLSRF